MAADDDRSDLETAIKTLAGQFNRRAEQALVCADDGRNDEFSKGKANAFLLAEKHLRDLLDDDPGGGTTSAVRVNRGP